jgi:hypothetical protein
MLKEPRGPPEEWAMSFRGPRRTRKALLAAAGALLLAAPPALAAGVQVGGVNLPGSQVDVPPVNVQVPGTGGPQVSVPEVNVPDVGGVGNTIDEVVPGDSPVLGGGSGGSGSGSSPSPAAPETPTPTAPTGGGETGGGTGGSPPPAAPPAQSGSQNGGGGNANGSGGGSADGSGGSGNGGTQAGPAAATAAQPVAGNGGRGEKASKDEPTPTLSTRIGDVISALPSGILVGLIGLAVVALLMTGRSAWFARATRRLSLQRKALQADVGVLQAALVPDLPADIGGIGVSVAYRPAQGPAAGGDFHDVFRIDRDTIGIVVGDVAGHGRDAVPRTGVVRYTIRAYLEAGVEPRVALRLADRALRGELSGDGEFATALAATFDRSSGRLVYSTAGHPHPIVLGADAPDPVEALGSPPIGVAGASGSRQTMLALGGACELWFFSDGPLEARADDGEGDVLGRAGLRREIERHRDPEALIAALPVGDDVTVCRLEVPAHEEVEPFSVETLLIERGFEPGQVREFFAACGMSEFERGQALDRIAAESRYEGEILVRVSRLGAVQHLRVERIQPELGAPPDVEARDEQPTAEAASADGAA